MNNFTGIRNPFEAFERELADVMTAFSSGISPYRVGRLTGHGSPLLNVWENEESVIVEAEVPGICMDEIDLNVAGAELTLKISPKNLDKEGKYHRRERTQNAAFRIVRLPYPVEGSKVEATIRNGVLTVQLPKAEAVRPRKITVRSC